MFQHISVLKEELVQGVALSANDCVIDATFGGGGHAAAVLEQITDGLLLGIDRDSYAINLAQEKFKSEIQAGRLLLIQGPFSLIKQHAASLLDGKNITVIYADLGVSSPQLDLAERGFSIVHDAPLDMRMDQESKSQTAADIVNQYEERELARIFRDFGEEPKASHYARKICERRSKLPFSTTRDLASFIEANNPYKQAPSRRHPATKIFQALRIEVNQELEEIQQFLRDAFEILSPGGRLAVISFHSLEDRLIKSYFKELASIPGQTSLVMRLPLRQSELPKPFAEIHKPFPIIPKEKEIMENPRSRSAKLRVLTKLRH